MQKSNLRYFLGLLVVIGLILFLLVNSTGYHNIGYKIVYVTLDEGRGYEFFTVENADPATFKDIGNAYAVDKERVYYVGLVIDDADPATISIVKEWGWSKDSKHIYAGHRRIQTCDFDTFKFQTNDWQADSKCVYRFGEIIQLADPNTFKVMNFYYGKDHRHVFYGNKLIEGADAETFHLFPGECVVCARDKNYCYRENEVVSCERFIQTN